jgi:flagellar P-ring protein precursor FlgI
MWSIHLKYLFLIFLLLGSMFAEKVKDIANIIGVRENQLIGYGLVVGLKGTGDGSSSQFTLRSLSNLLQTVNVKIDPDDIKSKNIAAVIVTSKLPSFARSGDKVDVSISSIGDAKSLEGGTLLMTPLKAVDGNIYAIAQGAITIGGRNSEGGIANHTTNAKIFEGAIVEKEAAYDIYSKDTATLSLKRSNFKTAVSVQNRLNKIFDENTAVAIDPRTIKLNKPAQSSMVEFLSSVLDADVYYEKEEKIVIDERTGTVVSGINILVDPVVITHGEITIKIHPQNYAPKEAKKLGDNVAIGVENNMLYMKKSKVTVANITRSLHKLGANPKSIISILETIKKAGAIRAKLEII